MTAGTSGVFVAESNDQIINNINSIAAGGTSGQAPPTPAPGADSFVEGLTAGATSMANGAQQMLASAQSGTLKFDPETGQSLIKTLNTHINDLHLAGADARFIAARSKLGMTEGGQAMSTFNEQVAASGSQAFLPAHQQFTESLQSAVQAIQVAMDNYAKAEDDNSAKFKAKE